MKSCRKCKNTKALTDFHKDKSRKDGLLDWCKKCKINSRIEWHKANLDKDLITKKTYNNNNTEKISNYRNQFKIKNPNYYAVKAKEYRKRLGENYNKRIREWDKEKRQNDPLYKLRRATSNRITSAIIKSGYTKRSKTGSIIGCDWLFFKLYIESLFQPGMTWDNYGEWEIDHIEPCLLAKTQDELLKLQFYTNLQPLWKEDHIVKTASDTKKKETL